MSSNPFPDHLAVQAYAKANDLEIAWDRGCTKRALECVSGSP
jgi:hypothetical protein